MGGSVGNVKYSDEATVKVRSVGVDMGVGVSVGVGERERKREKRASDPAQSGVYRDMFSTCVSHEIPIPKFHELLG
jgi:hypothetical protein